MKKRTLDKRIKLILSAVVVIVVVCGGLYMLLKDDKTVVEVVPTQEIAVEEQNPVEEEVVPEPEETTPAVVEKQNPTPPVVEPTSEWPVMLTKSEASSLTVVVNKKHKLPSDYVPDLTAVTGGQMRPEAAQALTSLLFKANEAGVPMSVLSSYRSYSTQVSTYNKWVSQSGKAAADTFSARPGHSEHQLGLAVDLGTGTCNLETCFGNTSAGKWLADNAQTYGFIIRYPSGKDSITGYQYEPWHLRYLGVDIATAIVNSGQTLDEYYGVEAGGY